MVNLVIKPLSVTADMSAKEVVDLVNHSFDDHGVDAIASTQLKLEAVSSVNTPATTGVVQLPLIYMEKIQQQLMCQQLLL